MNANERELKKEKLFADIRVIRGEEEEFLPISKRSKRSMESVRRVKWEKDLPKCVVGFWKKNTSIPKQLEDTCSWLTGGVAPASGGNFQGGDGILSDCDNKGHHYYEFRELGKVPFRFTPEWLATEEFIQKQVEEVLERKYKNWDSGVR
jgi:hypothetical protein